MAAEANLVNPAGAHSPIEQGCAIAGQGPVQMVLPVDPMHGEVVELLATKTLKDSVELSLTLREAETRQQFACDHPACIGLTAAPLQSLPDENFRWSVSRGCLDVIDTDVDGRLHHLHHLIDGLQRAHAAKREQADLSSSAEAPGVHAGCDESLSGVSESGKSESGVSVVPSPRRRRCRTRAAGLKSSTKRLKAL